MRQHLACVLACAICKVIGIFRCIPDGRNLLHKLLNTFTLRACGRTGGIGLAVIIKADSTKKMIKNVYPTESGEHVTLSDGDARAMVWLVLLV